MVEALLWGGNIVAAEGRSVLAIPLRSADLKIALGLRALFNAIADYTEQCHDDGTGYSDDDILRAIHCFVQNLPGNRTEIPVCSMNGRFPVDKQAALRLEHERLLGESDARHRYRGQ